MTQLVVVRHGDAGDRAEFASTGKSDRLRPLSRKGRKQMRAAARGLAALVGPADVIASSPYVRAVQTAEFVARRFPAAKQELTSTLRPRAAPKRLVAWINTSPTSNVVIVVGHEPDLGRLSTWLLAGLKQSRIELPKGGACLLTFEGPIRRGGARLRWLMGPKQLASAAK